MPNLTPEKYSSFLSLVVFAWFDPLAWKGWRRLLAYEELWGLAFDNR